MTELTCLSVPGCRVSLAVLDALSFGRDELDEALRDLRDRSGASQLCLLSTCERTELYATWTGAPNPDALVAALASNRGRCPSVVAEATIVLTGPAAARHLLRVAAGLESFVLGETDIVGQVRRAAHASRASGVSGLELERLLATAVNASRRVHRGTDLGQGGRSMAATAVKLAASEYDGDLRGRRVLVVGAGQVATEIVDGAVRLGAEVTVCNRTSRNADRFAAAGATVVDLAQLGRVICATDVAVFGTAAPRWLLDPSQLRDRHHELGPALLVIDLCVPRNVHPDVRTVPGVQLVDLSDLKLAGTLDGEPVTSGVARAEQIIEEEVDRYLRWLAGRSAAAAIRRLRADVDACARLQAEHAGRGVPVDLRPLVEDQVRRAVRRLAHGPTRRLVEAAESGDSDLVEILAALFAPSGAQ